MSSKLITGGFFWAVFLLDFLPEVVVAAGCFSSFFLATSDQMFRLPKILLTGSLFQLKVLIFCFGLGVSSWGSLTCWGGGGGAAPPGGGGGGGPPPGGGGGGGGPPPGGGGGGGGGGPPPGGGGGGGGPAPGGGGGGGGPPPGGGGGGGGPPPSGGGGGGGAPPGGGGGGGGAAAPCCCSNDCFLSPTSDLSLCNPLC